MQIILTKKCTSYTGSVGRGFGYHIQRRGKRFFGKRNSKGVIPPDGHLRFILACADIAKRRLHIADIRVSGKELKDALWEAYKSYMMQFVKLATYNADDIINFKTTFGL